MGVVQAAGAVAAVAAGVAGLAYLGRVGWRISRLLHRLVELLAGRPPRWPGDPDARPGLAEHLTRIDGRLDQLDGRLRGIEIELHQGGGASLRDQVTRDRAGEEATRPAGPGVKGDPSWRSVTS